MFCTPILTIIIHELTLVLLLLHPSQILTLEELRVNPFRERICKVFSEDNTGDMSFEDFLDMMSVFSEGATRDVKASYAFRIYG